MQVGNKIAPGLFLLEKPHNRAENLRDKTNRGANFRTGFVRKGAPAMIWELRTAGKGDRDFAYGGPLVKRAFFLRTTTGGGGASSFARFFKNRQKGVICTLLKQQGLEA